MAMQEGHGASHSLSAEEKRAHLEILHREAQRQKSISNQQSGLSMMPRGPQSLQRSKSGSSIAASAGFNLRGFRGDKQTLGMKRITSQPQFPLENTKERDRRQRIMESLEVVRQKEEDERGEEAKARKLKARLKEERKEQRAVEKARILEQSAKEQTLIWRAEQEERDAKIFENQEAERVVKEEAERVEKEEVDADRERKLPVTCSRCKGDGKCPSCSGAKMHRAMFLTQCINPNSVHGFSSQEFGQKPRGCESCYGLHQGIRGPCMEGTGMCAMCAGAGKFCSGHCHKQRKKLRGAASHANFGAGDATVDEVGRQTASPTASAPVRSFDKINDKELGGICPKCKGRQLTDPSQQPAAQTTMRRKPDEK